MSETPDRGVRPIGGAKLDPVDPAAWIERLPPFAARPVGQWRVSRLPSLTNHTFLVSAEDAALVLRLPAKAAALSIDRRGELHNLSIAASLGLAPPVRHMDESSGVLVTEYIAGSRALGPDDFQDQGTQVAVSRLLKRLGTSEATFLGRQDPAEAIDRYLAIHADREATDLRRRMSPWLEALRRTATKPVAAHVDPHPGNFLLRPDGGMLLIDWEFSAMADPCWDVAAILNSMPDDEAVMRRVASVSLGDANTPAMARLGIFQAALCLVAGSWAAMEAAQRGDPGLGELRADYLGKCQAWIDDDRVDAWLRDMMAGRA